MTRLPQCPACHGPRLLDDPTGLRVQHYSGCPFRERELARQLADADVARTRFGPWLRPATFVEREFLAAAGFPLAEDAVVEVAWITPSLRRRTFTDADGNIVDLDADEPSTSSSTADVTGSAGAA